MIAISGLWAHSRAIRVFRLRLVNFPIQSLDPTAGMQAWRRSYCLDLLFLGLLGFAISFLLALGHVDLLWVDDAVIARRISHCPVARRSSHRAVDLFRQLDFPDLMQTGNHDRRLGGSH